MKHVGLNVAADPLMTSPYLGIRGGFVLLVADDPGAYSSQNEQDSRILAKFAKIPCFEPSDQQEAKDLTKMAFDCSEEFGVPVMVRSLTRLSHSSSPVELGKIREQNKIIVKKEPAKLIAVPSNVVRLHTALVEKQLKFREYEKKHKINNISGKGKKKGVIACGIGYAYVKEHSEEFDILKISFYPFDPGIIAEFVKDKEEVWVIEEGEPVIEAVTRKYSKNVKGKISGDLSYTGELGPDAVTKIILEKKTTVKADNLPKRPPFLCAGCGHTGFFKALKSADPVFITGDIGCYTLGSNPPLNAMDTCLCMGASIGKAAGMSYQGIKRIAAVIGDSTFMHSGITGLISAVYNKANITVCILDNSATAMTGHQPTAFTGCMACGEPGGKADLEAICKAAGSDSVTVVDPNKSDEMIQVLKKNLDSSGVHVVIARRPCVFVAKKKK